MHVTCNFTACKIFNTQVEKYLKNKGEIQQYKIVTISLSTNSILNTHINTEGINGFDQQIKEKQKSKISNEFSFQNNGKLFSLQMYKVLPCLDFFFDFPAWHLHESLIFSGFVKEPSDIKCF
jgi:hypothetical protein